MRNAAVQRALLWLVLLSGGVLTVVHLVRFLAPLLQCSGGCTPPELF